MRRRARQILQILVVLGPFIAGCQQNTPPLEDARAVVERLHRNLIKIHNLRGTYREITEEGPFGRLTTHRLDYSADVEWLDQVKYEPAYKAWIAGRAASLICFTPTVVRKGERGPGLRALMDPNAYWQAPGTIYQRGQRSQISGELYFERVSQGWKWSCGIVTRNGRVIN